MFNIRPFKTFTVSAKIICIYLKSENSLSCHAFNILYSKNTYLNKSPILLIILLFGSSTSPVTTVCVNAQLKDERKSQMPNKDNKDQSGERTNTNNHSIEQNMIAEKESSL